MTEAPDVFSAQDNGVTEDNKDVNPANPQGDTTKVSGELDSLVGEGKKFKTVEELARGKKEADAFINRLQEELQGLRSELSEKEEARKMVEELRKELLEHKEPAPTKDASSTQVDIKSAVAEQLKELEAKKTAEDNLKFINEKMAEKYGKDAKEIVTKKAALMGVSKDFLQSVALQSPKAFLSMMGIEESSEPSPKQQAGAQKTSVSSSVNIEAVLTNIPNKAQKSYFDGMRKENPTLYWSPKIQNQIAKAIAEGVYF